MAEPLTFGIFPWAWPDRRMASRLGGLRAGFPRRWPSCEGAGPPLLPRTYVNWTGPCSTRKVLRQIGAYAAQRLPWDLVLCYRDRSGSAAKWASFVSAAWELGTLRDADSAGEGLFYHFGILRDDYSRKPAFARLRTLIAELASPRAG